MMDVTTHLPADLREAFTRLKVIRYYDTHRKLTNKAGILPFQEVLGERRYMVMRPAPRKAKLGPPPLQLCKGTRMFWNSQQRYWEDFKKPKETAIDHSLLEPLVITALREGQEELGLKLGNVEKVWELGQFEYISASQNQLKHLDLYAVHLTKPDHFDPIPHGTAERCWISLEDFRKTGRPDHLAMLNQAAEILAGLLKE